MIKDRSLPYLSYDHGACKIRSKSRYAGGNVRHMSPCSMRQ